MNRMMDQWKTDKLRFCLESAWLLTVLTSFMGSDLLAISFPAVGMLFPFRVMLPLTAVLYLVWAIGRKENPWKNASFAIRMCYVLIGVLMLYGAVSLTMAIDASFTFRRLFNLSFDLCFFFLMLHLCRDKDLLKRTVWTAMAAVLVLAVCGVYEVFCGGILTDKYDSFRIFTFLNGAYQLPIVTASNANDFVSMLVFTLALALLCWADSGMRKYTSLVLIVVIPMIYLLIEASDARLVKIGFVMLIVGMLLNNLAVCKKRIWIAAMAIALILCVELGQEYYRIKPAVQNTWSKISHSLHLVEGEWDPESQVTAQKPQTHIDVNSTALKEQFVNVNTESGEVELNGEYSAGQRVILLLHAFDCFRDSKGLGVGLGNTEQLSRLHMTEKTGGIWAIHCFIARLIADFGLWVLIPLAIVGCSLVWQGSANLYRSIKRKNKKKAAFWALYLLALLGYPFVSTASADAQDIIAMWLYLGGVVLVPMLERNSGDAHEEVR